MTVFGNALWKAFGRPLSRLWDRVRSEKLRKEQEEKAGLENDFKRIELTRAVETARHEREKHDYENKRDELGLERQEVDNEKRREQVKLQQEERLQQQEIRLQKTHERQVSAVQLNVIKRALKGVTDEELRDALRNGTMRMFDRLIARPNSALLEEPDDDDPPMEAVSARARPKKGGGGAAAPLAPAMPEILPMEHQPRLRKERYLPETD